jgi:hypothetical protein
VIGVVGLAFALTPADGIGGSIGLGDEPPAPADILEGSNRGIVLEGGGAYVFNSVQINAGYFDLTTSAIITNPNVFSFKPTGQPIIYGNNAVQQAVASGANLDIGYWDGDNGIMSSTAAADVNWSTAVGWVDNSLFHYGSWRGKNLTALPYNAVLISYTYYGDVNLNGFLDGSDRAIIEYSIAHPPANPAWQNGDINYDNSVDPADLELFDSIQGMGLPSLNFGAVVVPEPSTCLLLLVGCAAMAGYARRSGFLSRR